MLRGLNCMPICVTFLFCTRTRHNNYSWCLKPDFSSKLTTRPSNLIQFCQICLQTSTYSHFVRCNSLMICLLLSRSWFKRNGYHLVTNFTPVPCPRRLMMITVRCFFNGWTVFGRLSSRWSHDILHLFKSLLTTWKQTKKGMRELGLVNLEFK